MRAVLPVVRYLVLRPLSTDEVFDSVLRAVMLYSDPQFLVGSFVFFRVQDRRFQSFPTYSKTNDQ